MTNESVAMTTEADVAVLKAEAMAHAKLDDERFDRVCNDVADIKAMVRESNEFLQNGFQRVHGRIDEEASKARHNLGNEIGKTNGALTQAKQEANQETRRLEKWIYSTAITVLVGLLVYAVSNWGPLAK